MASVVQENRTPNRNESSEVQRMPSQAGYSREDWVHMLAGSYIKLAGADAGSLYRVSDVQNGRQEGTFVLQGRAIQPSNNARGYTSVSHNVNFTEENFESIFNWARRPAGIVADAAGRLYVLRPQVRRSRLKGTNPHEITVTRLSDGHVYNRLVEHFDDHTIYYMMLQLYGLHPAHNSAIRGRNAFGLVQTSSNLPTATVVAPADTPEIPAETSRVIGQIAGGMGRNFVEVPSEVARMDSAAIRGLARAFGINLTSQNIFYMEARVASVEGTTAVIEERADALLPALREAFPELRFSTESITE